MPQNFPLTFDLRDGTHVLVDRVDEDSYDFHLTRLNSEKHNFTWIASTDVIEESYETRFDVFQQEAVALFRQMMAQEN